MIAIVLNDGETWTNIEGCQIVEVRDDLQDELDQVDSDLAALEAFHAGAVRVIATFDADDEGFWKINYAEEA